MTTHSSKYRSSAVGHVIREHRKARGLTQKQLACELGVEARTLRMYENGERVLENISDLRRIADAEDVAGDVNGVLECQLAHVGFGEGSLKSNFCHVVT